MKQCESAWERRHPCLHGSGNNRLIDASRHGCLRSQDFSPESRIPRRDAMK
jgi:hypothetical protein